MKITNKTFRLKHTMLLLVALNILMSVFTSKLETIASFKSNYKLMKGRVQHRNEPAPTAPAPQANPQTPAQTPQANPQTPGQTQQTTHGAPIPKLDNAQPGSEKKTADDLPDMPVYFQGWIKYFRYIENGAEKPKMFFKNSAFEKQNVENNGPATDQFGPTKIPDEKHFFFVIYKDTANILTSRENPLMTVADSLIVDFIKTIPEDNNYLGGIKDFGKFSEGSCFEVATVKPGAFFKMTSDETEPSNGIQEVWLICTDDDVQKRNIMDILIKLKLKKQHQLGVYVSQPKDPRKANQSLNPENNLPTLADVLTGSSQMVDPEKINDPNKKPEDGYWIILQNWTPCTLKCGGGLQYLQLMCVPPKQGGAACKGDAIRTKPCNQQPCPQIGTLKSLMPNQSGQNPTAQMEKPIIKVMPISNRPQRYDKCYLKDSDALMVREDLKGTASFQVLPKTPIRLVMNNKSISVYQDETLSTQMMTFILKNTVFSRVKGDNRCFILNGINTRAQFCQLDSQSGHFVEEWDYDFHLFKNQCHMKREIIDLEENEEKKLEDDYHHKVEQLKLDMVGEKAKKVKRQVENKEEVKLEKKIEQTQAMTLMAIQKELKLEEMLEKEELQKEKEQEDQMARQISEEKKKDECLVKSIQEKQIEDQMNMNKANAEDAINQIKEEAKKTIMVKRAQMKKKLQMIRAKNRRKLSAMQSEIINIRVQTAGRVQKFAKVGNQANCFNPAQTGSAASQQIETYCQANFPDSNAKLLECKNPESFCYVCCESEFGDLHIPEREKCFKQVCETDGTAPAQITSAQKPSA